MADLESIIEELGFLKEDLSYRFSEIATHFAKEYQQIEYNIRRKATVFENEINDTIEQIEEILKGEKEK